MIKHGAVKRVVAIYQETGVFEAMEAGVRTSNRGRKRQLSCCALVVAIHFALATKAELTVKELHHILTADLGKDSRKYLGVLWQDPESSEAKTISIDQVRYLLRTFRKRYSQSDSDLLQDLIDRIISASNTHAPPPSGVYAADATTLHGWRDRRTDKRPLGDPDVEYGYTNSTDYTTIKDGTKMVSGYKATTITTVMAPKIQGRKFANPERPLPELVQKMWIDSARVSDIPIAKRFPAAIEAGLPIQMLTVDRGFSAAAATDFHIPLRELGVDLVTDLVGPFHKPYIDDATGQLVIRGGYYCPMTPTHLWQNPDGTQRVLRWDSEADRADYEALEAHRSETYATNRNGTNRLKCGASLGNIDCPAKEAPRGATPVHIVTPTAKELKSSGCKQETFTMTPETQGRRAQSQQRYAHGSPAWVTIHNSRSAAERSYPEMKSTNGLHRGRLKQISRATYGLFSALHIAGQNLHKIDLYRKVKRRLPLVGNPRLTAEDLKEEDSAWLSEQLKRGPPLEDPPIRSFS